MPGKVRTTACLLMWAISACTPIEDSIAPDASGERGSDAARTEPSMSVDPTLDAGSMDAAASTSNLADGSSAVHDAAADVTAPSAQEAEAAVAVVVDEICRGSAGSAICDAQGNLITCNSDATIKTKDACASRLLCQIGLQAKRCAVCEPGEFRCAGKTLEVCATDGMSYSALETCETERLCNKVAGTCTSLLCAPNKFSCDSNILSRCSADGTRFESQTPCGSGSCDAVGGQCDTCVPGQKKCEGAALLTCSATGQGFTSSNCASGTKCIGAGQCAACGSDGDCSAMTSGCKVGLCGAGGTCTTGNAADGTQCTTAASKPGMCAAGVCRCTPQCANKQCGDDGCGTGGQCPSLCTGGQMCSNFKCVACTAHNQCGGSSDGCKIGMCTDGACTTIDARQGTPCSVGVAMGKCSAGACDLGPEVAVGDVIQNNGFLVTVGLGNKVGTPIGESWGTCPTGMTELNRLMDVNGFWLCVRNDLTNRTFYVGDVESSIGALYRVTKSSVGAPVGENWGACYEQSTLLGTWVGDANGFWVCMK